MLEFLKTQEFFWDFLRKESRKNAFVRKFYISVPKVDEKKNGIFKEHKMTM